MTRFEKGAGGPIETPQAIHVAIGRWAVARGPGRLQTLLGSCVGVMLHDRLCGLGGLAHVVLPSSRGAIDHPGKYADTAIPALLAGMREQGSPATRGRLTAKLAGGARMLQMTGSGDIGQANAEALEKILSALGIPVVASDLGGQSGRRLVFEPATGFVLVRRPAAPNIPCKIRETAMPRLLIVDDALIMRKVIRDVATTAGWEIVAEGANGQEAIDLYSQLHPDLVTLDLVMPQMGGLEALGKIRQLDPNARVIVISAVDQKEALLESIRLGALDFVVKPFDHARLASLFGKMKQQPASGPVPPA